MGISPANSEQSTGTIRTANLSRNAQPAHNDDGMTGADLLVAGRVPLSAERETPCAA